MTAPKTSGIAAAIGERKTSSRTMQEDRQGDQLAALGGVDRLAWITRERVAYPVWVALTGGWTCSGRGSRSRSSTDSLTDSASPTWKSITISACRGLGRRLPDRAAVPGREGGDPRVAGAQGADQVRALAVERGRRAAQENRERRRATEVLAQDGVGLRGGGAGNVERGRAQTGRRPRAEGCRESARTRAARAGADRGYRSGRNRSRPRRHRGSLAVRDAEGAGEAGKPWLRSPRQSLRNVAPARDLPPVTFFRETWVAAARSHAQSCSRACAGLLALSSGRRQRSPDQGRQPRAQGRRRLRGRRRCRGASTNRSTSTATPT